MVPLSAIFDATKLPQFLVLPIYKNKQKLKFKIAINHVNKKVMQLADKK